MTGYFDLQVNGFHGVDFNADDSDVDAIREACLWLADDGATAFLPTIITAELEKMIARISAVAAAIDADASVAGLVRGIHVEGPFINPADGFVGAHPRAAVLPADPDVARRLIDAGRGHVRLVTLAPESDADMRTTSWLAGQGIVVAAGHSDASRDELAAAADAGLSLFTHLGNGCPGVLPRHDNIVQRVLSLSDRLFVSFIADGHHVPMFALQNYLQTIAPERIVIVSDAITAAGLGPGRHRLSDQVVDVDADGAAWSADRKHFAGSATPISRMTRILRDELGIDDTTLRRWTWDNPGRLMGLERTP